MAIPSRCGVQDVPQFFCKFGLPERLFQYVAFGHFADPAPLGVTGHEQRWHARDEPPSLGCKLSTVHVGHRQIDDQEIEPSVPLQKVKRSLAASRLDHLMAECSYQRRGNSADSAVVVDHENAREWPGVALALADRFLRAP